MTPEDHLRVIKYLQELYAGNRFYVECNPTDIGAKCFPNSNFAIKEIDLHKIYKTLPNHATEVKDK